MKNIICGIFSLLLIAASPVAHSTVLDFEDLVAGTTYNVTDSFVTSGVTVSVNDFTFSSGTTFSGGFTQVQANVPTLAGGSVNELAVNNVLLDFNFGGAIPGLDLLFGEYGGNLNLDINGDFRNFQNFADIAGLNIGGVNVSVVNGLGNDLGSLSLSGAINSFAIGGQELWIDNVSAVPLPAAVWLFGAALLGLAGYTRKNRQAA